MFCNKICSKRGSHGHNTKDVVVDDVCEMGAGRIHVGTSDLIGNPSLTVILNFRTLHMMDEFMEKLQNAKEKFAEELLESE